MWEVQARNPNSRTLRVRYVLKLVASTTQAGTWGPLEVIARPSVALPPSTWHTSLLTRLVPSFSQSLKRVRLFFGGKWFFAWTNGQPGKSRLKGPFG